MSVTSVLYDRPGPIGRRRIRIASAVVTLVLVGCACYVLVQLAHRGQLSMQLWGPIVDPRNQQFAAFWNFFGGGLMSTLTSAGISIVLAVILGVFLALARMSAGRFSRPVIIAFIELMRGIPIVVTIFVLSQVLPEFHLGIPVIWYLVIGITAYHAVAIAEIVRAGIHAVPRGQTEAALAIGLSPGRSMRLIVLPQAIRLMLPALIAQLVRVLKDTSLGFIVSYGELLSRGQIAAQNLNNPFQVYFVVGVIFIAINLVLTLIANRSEAALNRTTRTRGGAGTNPSALDAAPQTHDPNPIVHV